MCLCHMIFTLLSCDSINYYHYQCINYITLLNSEYFQQIGWRIPNDDEMVSLLRKAVSNSRQKHYHGGKGIDVLSPEGMLLANYCIMYPLL